MYAIVECSGQQYRVTPDQVVHIPKTDAEPGTTLTFDRVLFVHDGSNTQIGTPHVSGAAVKAEVLSHGRDKKVIVAKFKRRKDYRRKNGHRQHFTEVKITSIAG